MLQNSPMYAYIPAKDVSRARRFYEQQLGFKPNEEIAGGVVYEFGAGTACFLYPTPNAGTSKASQAFWQVNDIEREVAELKARGVEFEDYDMEGEKSPSGVVTAGGAKAAWFKDRGQHHGDHSRRLRRGNQHSIFADSYLYFARKTYATEFASHPSTVSCANKRLGHASNGSGAHK
jgi:predicted enzyme related to lactoylglutathione lyase